jgi:hypothetical protein
MGMQFLPPTMGITAPISPSSLRRPAVCVTKMIIVPQSADEALWSSFSQEANAIREAILLLSESKMESREVLLLLPLPPSLMTRVQKFIEQWFKVETLESVQNIKINIL